MNDLFEGFEGVKLVEAASDPFADFEGVTLVDQAAPAAGGPLSAFRAKLADPKEYERIKKWAAYHGMTPEDPIVARRLTNPLNFSSYSTLMKLAESGDPDEVNDLTPEGNVAGLGLKAAFYQFAHAGGAFRRRNDALVSRIAAGQELEVGDTLDPGARLGTSMPDIPMPSPSTIRQYKKIEDMTRAEQDATVPKEIIDLVNQYDTPEAPLDARTRAKAIYEAAKSSAMARAKTMEMAKEELALREELAGNTGGFLGFLEKAGVLAAKGVPTVGYSNTFLALTPYGAGVVSGMDKTTELLSADINPDTGEVEKYGTDYDDARLRGYAYGAYEAATEVLLGKILGAVFKGADKLLTGGRVLKGSSKAYDALARRVLKTRIGRGIAEFAKGVQRIASLSATNNPFTELGEEGIQQWGDAVFAQRPSDTEVPVYVKNVFNEATGEIEQMRVEPGSDEERTAKRMLARYGEKSGYAEAGTRQMTVGEKTKEFAWGDGVNKGFVSWENLTALAEGFALQYVLTLGTGAMHAVQTKRGRHIIDTYLRAAGFTDAETAYMSDERKYKAFVAFYGAEANRDKFPEVFKDAGEWLSLSAQRVVDSERWMRTGEGIKPNFTADLAKEIEAGATTVDDEKSGLSVDYTSTLEGTAFTVRDRDGVLSPMTFNTAEEAQKGAEKMSQMKQGRQMDMEKRAEIATRVAQVFAPGRNVVLVQSDKDMKAAAVAEGADAAQYKSGNPGLTAPNGTIVLNVAAITSFDELVQTVKHETGHSVADEAGLTKLMAGKTVNWIAAEFQKAKIIAPGKNEREKFVKAVESVRADYAARGVKLGDADAVAEVLSMLQERMTPLFRKKFGDGLVTLLRGKDKSAKNMRDVRRAVALIMYSGREAKVDLYGGPDAWKVPAPAFTGDPIAAAGTETGEKEAVEPAGEAAPEAMPAQGEEAPGAEAAPPVAAPEAKPPAAPSPEAVAAAKDIKAAFEEKQKAKAPVEEATKKQKEFPIDTKTGEAVGEVGDEIELENGMLGVVEEAKGRKRWKITRGKRWTTDYGKTSNQGWKVGDTVTPDELADAGVTFEQAGTGPLLSGQPVKIVGITRVRGIYLVLPVSSVEEEAAPAAPSPEAEAAAKEIKAAFEAKQKAKAPVEEAAPVETPPEAPKAEAPKAEPPAPATPVAKMTFPTEEAMLEYVAAHPEETANWSEENFEIVPPPAPAKSDGAPIVPTSEAGRGEAPAVPLDLEGGTPAEIEAEKAKVEAQRKKQEERDEIAKKAAAPLKGDLGDSTPPLPGMEGVAPDDLELLNQKPKEAQDGVQKRGAEAVAGEEPAGSGKADGGGDAQGSEAAGTAGKPEGEGLQKRAVEVEPQVAKMSAEVTFESVPKKGQYAEIPGVSTAQGKRMYLIQGKWGNGSTFHVSPTHHGIVLTGMGVLLRTKGQPSAHSGVRIIGGGKAPAGSEKWGVAEWATHNQKLSNRHKEGAKAAVPTASDSAPTAEAPKTPDMDTMVAEARRWSGAALKADGMYDPADARSRMEHTRITTKGDMDAYLMRKFGISETTARDVSNELTRKNLKPDTSASVEDFKGEPWADKAMEYAAKKAAPAPKMKFASEEEMMRYVSAHPEETANWTEESFEIVPDEKGEAAPAAPQAEQEAAPEAEQEAAPAVAQFEPPKIKYGENTGAYRRRVAAAKAEWDKEQAAKAEADKVSPEPRQSIDNVEPTTDAKDAEEIAELQANAETQARVRAIPDADYNAAPALAAMDAELPAYEARKASSTRTADSKERQAYSTPPPLAAIGAAALANARGDNADAVTVIEPTAGNGGLIAVLGLSEGDKVLANELDEGRAKRLGELFLDATVTQGDYAAEAYQQSVRDAAKDGPRAFLMNPPFGPADESGYKLEHKIALKTIESAVPGDTLFFIGAAPGRNAMKMPTGALAGVYTAGAFAKFHQELNRRGWKATLHFIADGALYRKMGASFPVEVLLMEKTDGSEMNPHMPMRDLPARYSTWEQIRAAVAEMYDPGAETLGERVANDLNLSGKAEQARAEAQGNAEASSAEVNAARVKEAGGIRYRLVDQTETPEFKRWFGDSKVVDADGKPLVVYHGVKDADMRVENGAVVFAPKFDVFDTKGRTEPGAWFSPDPKVAAKYGTPIPFYLKAVAPVREEGPLTAAPENADAVYRMRGKGDSIAQAWEIAVFRPEQIKSATDNRGTFDPDNPGIRYRLSQDIELGLVTPETGLTLNPFMTKINGKVWDKEFAGKVHNPDQLARHIVSLPAEIAEARIKVADAIAKYLAANPANGFVTGPDFHSMGPALREAFEARWNAARTTDMDAEEDKAQLEYDPLSAVKVASPMKVPRELAGGMAAALISFDERHPEGIDTFVAEKMRRPMTEKELDGSQIDTLGLALEKIDDGTGFIVGSQTGAGKGRVMASVMDYHILNGRVPLFLTAQAKLFTDIWRDITAIGAQDRFKPLVMNDYKAPKNEDPDSEDADAFSMPLFFTPVRRNSALSEGKLPQGANAIFLTYSQVQNPTANTRRKIDLIKKLLVSGKGALVMDEAHLAAGADSNRGAVLREFADLAKPGVVFSSATFAKRGENMTLYKRAGYSQFFKNDEDMEKALMVGGVPFQQYLAARLTERGFYVRHELDYENVIFEKLTTIDTLGTPQERTALSQREEQIADVFNQAVRSVIRFGGMVKKVNSRLQKGAPVVNMDGAAFMSNLHNTASFIYTALKAETVANAAVAELRAGRAPVVTLYNTNQALLTEIGLGQNADVGRYLTRISERAVSIQMPDGSSASILTPAGFGELVRLVKTQEATMLRDAADALVREARSAADYLREQNLPASPIDRVREIVQNAGYQFGEVTRRTLMVQNGVVVRRIRPNPDTVIHQFNQGAPDGSPNMVLLLSSSGSTGLSAHASSDFRNQAQRVMFVLQPAWDINEMMQMFGRVNRKNQLSKPIYHLVFTSAAGEQRNAAILMSKLRSLSANTSGVSKAGYGEEVEDALDFMNAFGDKALGELAAERNPVVAAINALRPSTGIRAATSISQFLPVREQEEFIGQIQAKVAALQDNAREAGLHDLEAGDIGRVPLTVEQLLSDSAMRAYEVPVLGRGKILTASEAVAAAQAWQAKHPTMLDDAKAKIDKAIAGTTNPWLKRIYGNTAQVLEHALDSIGQVYYVRDDVGGGRRWFVPTEVRLPPSGTAQTASDWRVKVSFNTIRGVTTIPLSIFSDKILSNAAKSSERNYNETLTRKEDRTIIAGDVAQALIGNIVATGASGTSQIVRALPADGNFSSFVLMMPRGVTVANAKKIVSSRLEKVTDVMDIRVGKNGYLEIDAGRVKVTPTYSSTTGDQIGAVFAFRIATPIKAKSKKITVAEIMRAAGAESRLRDTPDSRGYVTGPYLGVDEANTALKNLAALHPALQATQIVSDEAKVGGQDAVARNAPRFKLAGVKLDAAAEPVFFSQLRRTLEAKMPNRMTVMALRGMIDPAKGSGVKADEIEWTGLKDFLDGKNPGDYVTKAEVLEAVRDVEIREVVKGAGDRTSEVEAWWNDEGGANEEKPYSELTHSERMDAIARYIDEVEPYEEDAPKFADYQLDGGENYRELLLTLPVRIMKSDKPAGHTVGTFTATQREDGRWEYRADDGRTLGSPRNTYEELTGQRFGLQRDTAAPDYTSPHFSEPNILAHVRFNERQAANGDKTLFLEEVQSDWHQAGREKGYAKDTTGWTARLLSAPDAGFNHWQINDAKGNEVTKIVGGTKEAAISKAAEGVPDAPFKDTSKGWARLAFKRMLRWAAENGFDRIAWTTGEQQAERYELSKQVDSIKWTKMTTSDAGEQVSIKAMKNGQQLITEIVSPDKVADYIGKELAKQIVESSERTGEIKGDNLKVGGEGMRTFYDQILPSIANDIGKKFGARVEDVGINETTRLSAPQKYVGPELSYKEVETQYLRRDINATARSQLRDILDEMNEGVSFQTAADKISPLTARVLGGDIEYGKLPDTIVHSLPITPAMRDSVMQGQPRFKLPGVTLDAEHADAVAKGDMETAQRMVDEARTGTPYTTPKLYHGTPNFGFTTFGEGNIFASESSERAGEYTGRSGVFAGVREIWKTYATDDGTAETLLKNAKAYFGSDAHFVTQAERNNVLNKVDRDSESMANKVDSEWTSEATSALANIKNSESFSADGFDFESALATFLSFPRTLNDVLRENRAADGFARLPKYISDVVQDFNQVKEPLRQFLDDNFESVRGTAAEGLVGNIILGYGVTDLAIEAKTSVLSVLENDTVVTDGGSRFVRADDVRRVIDQIRDVGAYQLYGNPGNNPLVIDAKGGHWEAIPVPQWGGRFDTNTIAKRAKADGYTSVNIRNVIDPGKGGFSENVTQNLWIFFNKNDVKSADAATYDDNGNLIPLSRRFDDARADIRFKLPGVTLDDDISAPVRVGELRTQTQLENDDPVGFPILDHIRGGSRIIIPRGAIGRKGEYDWFTEAGGLKAFTLAEQKAFFRYPNAALGEKKSRGNIDQLAKELEPQLGTDDVETFANAFMAEVERSRALYREQKERQAVRRDVLETFSESPYLAGMKDIGENLGKAVGYVYASLQGEEKATLEMIYDREGTDAVRDYILRQHIDLVALDMIERHAFQMEVESGARDEAPPIIQDRGTLAIDTPVNEKGDTRFVFDQTKESLDVKRARLYAQALQGVPTITDEAAAAHVREALDVGGKIFLRDIAQKLTAERLTGATTRPLDKLQTAIMLWYQIDLDERIKDSDRQAQAAVEAHDLNNLNAVDMMRDSLHNETIDYLNAARQYGSLAGQALQALKLRMDHAFNIVKIYRQAREDIGRDLTRAEFEKLKARIDILEKKWNDYVDAATLPDGEGELDTRVVELEKKLADVTAARAAVKTEVDRLEAKKAALEAEYAKQSREATVFSEKKAQLEAQIAGIENEIALREALNQQVEELQGKVDALQAKLDALDTEYAGASPELLASLEKQLADLTKLHAEKLAAYQKTDEELKTANERLKRVRKLIEKLGKGTKAKIVRRRAIIENAANLYKEFKAEMERAQVEQLKTRWRSAPLPKKALMAFGGVENIIQGLQSMADESVAGRQLIKIGRGHPILFLRAFAQSQHIVFHRSGMTDETGRTLTWQERSDRYYYELDQAQREDPLFDILVRKGGLDWMDITADPTSFDEQQIPIGPLLNNMFPSKATRFVTSVLGVSNNHYAGMSNMLRFAVAKQLYNQMSVAKGETPNEDDIYAIVSTVDIFGGRGDLSTKTARAVLDFGRHLLYSPRLALANAQYYRRMVGMLANPRYSRQARKMILMEYVRSGIGYATLSFIARVLSWLLYDDKDQQRFQFRSGHTAYTQLMFGQQRVDITGGQATWDRAVMNFLGGGLIDLLPEWARDVISVIDNGDKLATETGLVITEQYKREKGDYDALGRFARSKLKPLTGMFLDLARGKNYEGQAAGPRAQPHQPGYDRRYLNLLRSIAPVPLSLQTAGELYMGDPDQGIEPVRNPFLFVSWMSMELLGMLARSLPVNAELAQQVAEGYTKNAEELESLKRKQRDIMNDRKMSPEMKEIKARRIQDKIDRLRGL